MNFLPSSLKPASKEEHPDEEDRNVRVPEVDKEQVYRVSSILCYFFVLIVIGLPVWWYTTRVYRASLPLHKMFNTDLPNKTSKQLGMPLSLKYDILITIVNPDPENLKIALDGGDIEYNLRPFLDEISSIGHFVVKSQWLYLVELGAVPRKIVDHYALYEAQLPHVITPLEKKLWSHIADRPCINLVLYVPHCHVPLYIYDGQERKNEHNAFLSPGWGGISILNPDQESCERKLFRPDLSGIVSVFQAQIRKLFNIESDFGDFQKRKIEELTDSTRRTLMSLAQLLSEIPSIVIGDHVAGKIHVAIEKLDLIETALRENEILKALEFAKIAYENSENAFGDPSLLALLYFPDDQKYAVYIPLFLPVMIPVFMSLWTVKKWYANRNCMKLKAE